MEYREWLLPRLRLRNTLTYLLSYLFTLGTCKTKHSSLFEN